MFGSQVHSIQVPPTLVSSPCLHGHTQTLRRQTGELRREEIVHRHTERAWSAKMDSGS